MALFGAKTKIKSVATITVEPVTQLSVTLNNIPGELARIATALAEADISIDGLCRTDEPGGVVTDHFVLDKVPKAREVFARMGKESWPKEILKFTLTGDRPGIIAAIATKFGELKINIENVFHASSGRGNAAVIYVAVQPVDFDRALKAGREIK